MCIVMASYIKKHPLKSIAAFSAVSVIVYKIDNLNKPGVRKKSILIESSEEWFLKESEILKNLHKSRVLGLDCEWVTENETRSPISLLQLANEHGFCVLIRLSLLKAWTLPISLIELLANKDVLKVGVGIAQDVNKLLSDYSLEVNGFLDLRFLAQNLKEMQGKSLSLKSLGYELLGEILNKDEFLRCSDWNSIPLSVEQIEYAAEDAIIAAKIFFVIKKLKCNSFWWSNQFSDDVLLFIDKPFKQKNVDSSFYKSRDTSKTFKKSQKLRYSKPRLKPMYDNCQLVAPDGELLCSCDRGKAEWYIFKGLGEKISNDPFTVCLNFEPSGRPRLDNVFYTMEKSNQCVVCGSTQNFHRKLVVPSEYRKYFPDLMKKNLSHDVLLLCVYCHKKSNMIDQQMRQKLALLCDAPLGCKKNVKYKFNPEVAKVKSAATALKTSGGKIPLWRKEELINLIACYYNTDVVTDDILTHACELDTTLLNKGFIPHGLKVYQYFCNNGGLMKFEKMWRQHFLDTMKPKFLPVMWSVEHNHQRLALQVQENNRDINFDVSILGIDEGSKDT